MRRQRRRIIGDPDLWRARAARRTGLRGLRGFVSGMAAPRGFTVTAQVERSGGGSGGGSGGFSSGMSVPGSPYSPSGPDGSSADEAGDDETGARWFTCGLSACNSADIVAP